MHFGVDLVRWLRVDPSRVVTTRAAQCIESFLREASQVTKLTLFIHDQEENNQVGENTQRLCEGFETAAASNDRMKL